MGKLRHILKDTDPKDFQISKFVALMAKDCQDDTVRILFGDETTKEAASSNDETAPGNAENESSSDDKSESGHSTKDDAITKQYSAKQRHEKTSTFSPASHDNTPLGIVIHASLNTFDSDPKGELHKRLKKSNSRNKEYHDILWANEVKYHG